MESRPPESATTSASACLSLNVNAAALNGNTDLFRLRTAAGGPIAKAYVNASGVLVVRSDVTSTQQSSGVALGSGWHQVELCGTVGAAGAWDLYRDGADSVAWHGDRFGRAAEHDTMVAIVSLGSPRALLLRPRGGGESIRQVLGHGDLLVMGGSCQRTWDHCVPKTSTPVGPRISIQFRPRGVR